MRVIRLFEKKKNAQTNTQPQKCGNMFKISSSAPSGGGGLRLKYTGIIFYPLPRIHTSALIGRALEVQLPDHYYDRPTNRRT